MEKNSTLGYVSAQNETRFSFWSLIVYKSVHFVSEQLNSVQI